MLRIIRTVMTMILTRLIIAPRYLLRKGDFIVVRPRLSIRELHCLLTWDVLARILGSASLEILLCVGSASVQGLWQLIASPFGAPGNTTSRTSTLIFRGTS